MSKARQNWIRSWVLGALCLSANALILAQSNAADSLPRQFVQTQAPQSGSLAGRLTDLHSAPLAGVSIVLRNRSTGTEVRATTARNGAFRIASLDTGEYTLDAEASQLGHGRLDGILVTGGIESRLQVAMEFEPDPPALIEATAPAQTAAPPKVETHLPLNAAVLPASTRPIASSAVTFAPVAPPVLSRPALSISAPQLIASIDDEPLMRLPLTVLPETPAPFPTPVSLPAAAPKQTPAAGAAHASSYEILAPSALQHVPPRSRPLALPSRAALETQSAPIDLALSVAQPKVFPVKAGTGPAFAATVVPPSLEQAAMLAPPPVSSTLAQPSEPVAPVVSTTVSASQLQSLPASGRRWQEFLLDTPAAGTAADSSQSAYRGSQEPAEVTVDGANIGLAFGVSAGSAMHGSASTGADSNSQSSSTQSGSQAWTGGRGLGVSEAAIREVTTAAGNVEAEGMRPAGGRTAIRTQSGGNALHGQGFFFDRQNTWGAQNPFTQWVQNTGSTAAPNFTAVPFTPPDHETVWGLGLGSDIRRNRLFWFAALDSNQRNDPGLSTVRYPAEFFYLPEPTSASVTLLSAQLGESQNQAYNDYLGVAASGYGPAGLEQLASLLGPAPRTSTQWVGFGRIDWQAAERHHFSLEGIGADLSSPGGGLTRVSETYGSHSYGSSQANQQWLLARWEAYVTTNLLAVTQGSVGRAILSARPDTPSTFEQCFLGAINCGRQPQPTDANSYGQLPQIVVDSRYGFTIGNPSRFGQGSYPDERLFHEQEMLDWVHNKLLVKAGFELDHNADAVTQLRNQTGTYSYSTVASFISDALAFQKFGLNGALNPSNPHNCGVTDTTFGSQPCYSYYSQTMGPTNWHLSTNDWAGYTTAQWQLSKLAVFSAGLRWEREQMPPPVAALDNPELPFTEKLPELGNNWGPRVSLAIGNSHDHWPVLRLGYGMYYGRVENATIETALTQTGSLKGDLYFFMRPQDDCQYCSGGSPPFPYVLSGEPSSVVKPGVVGFAPNFRNPEIHQAVAAVEQALPAHIQLTASAMVSLGRRLPVSIDTNVNTSISSTVNTGITYNVCDQVPVNPNGTSTSCGHIGAGPIKTAQVTVPYFYASSWPTGGTNQYTVVCPYDETGVTSTTVPGRLCPDYQAITQITSKANFTYEAVMVKLVRYGRRGLSFHAHYTYAHAMDWNPDAVTLAPGSDVLDPGPAGFSQEYGTSNQDVRHSAAVMAIFEAPWKLRGLAGRLGNGWALSGIGQFHSGLPYSMRITGSIPTAEESDATGLGSSMNGYGGDNRYFGLPRNTFRYPETWKADLRLAKRFDLGEMRQLELLAETFNLFNHQNVTEIETTGYSIENGGSTTLPSLNFLTGLYVNPKTGLTGPAFGQPLSINGADFYRERQIEIGLRMRF